MTCAEELAEYVARLDYSELPDDVVTAIKRAILDCVSAMLSGVNEPVTRCVVAEVHRRGGVGEASVIGHRLRVTAIDAALLNGTMAHATDFDDVSWSVWGHATAPVLPAVFALGESAAASGRDLIVALAAGLEVAAKLGRAVVPEHYEAGWHSTVTLGVIGAAVGGARVCRLDEAGVGAAMEMAASRAAGLRVNFGTMTKALHVGWAARDGVEVARLAGMGVSAHPAALDGPFGFLKVLAPEHRSVEAIRDSLGRPFDVVDPGLTYKMYPSCADGHAAVDAILELRARYGIRPDAVRRIRCGVTPLVAASLVYHAPQTSLEAKFSLEFSLSAALARGRLGMEEFDESMLRDPVIQRLMQRVEMAVAPTLSGRDALIFSPAIVEIEMECGVVRSEVRVARGNPKCPLSTAELEEKFLGCAGRVLGREGARRGLHALRECERLKTVGELLQLFVPPLSRRRTVVGAREGHSVIRVLKSSRRVP